MGVRRYEAEMNIRADWKLIKSQLPRIHRESVKLCVSDSLVAMLIAAEDHRYGMHPGVDPVSICRAVWRSIFCRKREGGSTIAMQLVRVITGRYEKTVGRKFAEIVLAVRLTSLVHSADLPRFYLVVAYYGWRMNGLAQAAQRLGMNPSEISQVEAASIVARLKYPEPKMPDERRLARIRTRTTHILRRANLGSIPATQLELSESNGSF